MELINFALRLNLCEKADLADRTHAVRKTLDEWGVDLPRMEDLKELFERCGKSNITAFQHMKIDGSVVSGGYAKVFGKRADGYEVRS